MITDGADFVIRTGILFRNGYVVHCQTDIRQDTLRILRRILAVLLRIITPV